MNRETSPGGPAEDRRLTPDDAQQCIAQYLSGRNTDPAALRRAMRDLHEQAPERMEAMWHALLGETARGVGATSPGCEDMAELMPAFAALGAEGPARMPAVAAHLAACARCQLLHVVHEELAAERAEWVSLSRRMSRPKRRLELAGRIWNWVQAGAPARFPLSREDIDMRQPLGRLILRPALAAALHFGDVPEALSLSVSVGASEGTLNLAVVPRRDEVRHVDLWEIVCELDSSSRVPTIDVALGSEQGPLTGMRAVRQGKQAVFEVSPASQETYWLHLQWMSGDDRWRDDKVELPLCQSPEEGGRR